MFFCRKERAMRYRDHAVAQSGLGIYPVRCKVDAMLAGGHGIG